MNKRIKNFFLILSIIICCPGQSNARILFQDEDFHLIPSEGLIINNDDLGDQDVTIQLGNDGTDAKIFFDDSTGDTTFITPGEDFLFTDNLIVDGDINQNGVYFILDSDNTGAGEDIEIIANQGTDNDGVLLYNATDNRWEVSNDGGSFFPIGSGELAPYVENVYPKTITPNTSTTLYISGGNLDYNTNISIPGWSGTIDEIRHISNTEIEVDITTDSSENMYSIVLINGSKQSTGYIADNGENVLEVKTPTWLDLRLGGDSFTDGNSAGNDIRYASGMSMSRDSNGMYFTGDSPWGSWVKFESLAWVRGDDKTLQWIFSQPDSSMMIGIGSDATNENSNSQYAEAEVESYFSNSNTFWGLYGNTGTLGSAGYQNISTNLYSCSSDIFKIKYEGDGDNGDRFTLYCLPSSDRSDWDNESNILRTFNIGGSLDPDETNIMPFIIPRNGGSQRFLGVKLE